MTTGKTTWARRVLLSIIVLFAFHPLPAFAGWVENGAIVCQSDGEQWYPFPVPDGTGGVILIWQDYRSGTGNVFLQKLGEGGEALWTDGGIPVTTITDDREFFRQGVSDGAGGAAVIWTDHRNASIDIYCQRISSGGSALWQAGGVAVASSDADEYFPAAAGSGDGGLFAAWQTGPEGSSNIVAQKITPAGEAAWGASGVEVSASAGGYYPSVVPDGAGGAIVIWISGSGSGTEIRAQRVSSAGALMWGPGGVAACSGCEVRSFMEAGADGSGGAVFAWQDLRNGDQDIYAQRLDSSGSLMWSADGTPVASGPGDQWLPAIASEADGGLVAAWVDDSPGDADVRAQRLGPDGSFLWGDEGVAIASADGQQLNPRIASNTAGEAVVAWQDGRSGGYDIYAQKVSPSGVDLWSDGGIPVSKAAGDQRLPELVADAAGGAVITWESRDSQSDIFCQRISASGDCLAISLASFMSRTTAGAIELEWVMAEIEPGIEFAVSRKESGDQTFDPISGARIDSEEPSYSFTDTDVEPGVEYVYLVEALSAGKRTTLFETRALSVPAAAFALEQNYPNPFNPVTTISYYLARRSRVELSIIDVSGRMVAVLVSSVQDAGRHSVVWNGADDLGRRAASGVYFSRMTAGKTTKTRKMVLLR